MADIDSFDLTELEEIIEQRDTQLPDMLLMKYLHDHMNRENPFLMLFPNLPPQSKRYRAAVVWHQSYLLIRDSVEWAHRWTHRALRRWIVDPYEDRC